MKLQRPPGLWPWGQRPWRAGTPVSALAAVVVLGCTSLAWSWATAARWGAAMRHHPVRFKYMEQTLLVPGAAGQERDLGRRGAAGPSSYTSLRSSWALSVTWQPPLYSTHTCISQKFDDAWQMATCKFDNVCLNSTTLEFEYYQSPDFRGIPVAYDQRGKAHYDFPETMVNPGHRLEGKHTAWSPRVVRRRFPREDEGAVWAPSPQALLQALPVKFATNFGHVLMDVAVPYFNMQHLFGVYTSDAQPLILGAQGGSEEKLRRRLGKLINPRAPERSLLRLTWDRDAAWLAEYARSVLGRDRSGLICFRTVLAGTGYLSRRMSRVDSLPYRQAVVGRLGLREQPEKQPLITILKKHGRRAIENSNEILATLRGRYPTARVAQLDFDRHPNLTMAQQVELMSKTSILVSPCGGMATVLTFLQPGATAIVMNYWDTLKGRSLHLEDEYYRNIEYLDIQYFPVTLADYEGTRDRPGCELRNNQERRNHRYREAGALVYCNVRLGAGKGMQRLLDFVDAAMLRWAARTGRYEAVASLRSIQELSVGGSLAHPLASGGGAGAALRGAQRQQPLAWDTHETTMAVAQ